MVSIGTTIPPASANETAPDHVVLRLRLLGPMEAWTVRGLNVLPVGRKTRALLAMVAMSAPRPISRSRLAEHLWSRGSEEQARASLRQEIHRLVDAPAAAESELLIVTRDHVSLRPGAVWIDLEEVTQPDAPQAATLCSLDADLLEDLDGLDPNFDAWLRLEREGLRNRALRIAESILQDILDPDAAIAAAQKLLSIDRSHEGAW